MSEVAGIDLRLLCRLVDGCDELLIRMAAERMTRLMLCSMCRRPVFGEPDKWNFDARQEFVVERAVLMHDEGHRANMAEWERDVGVLTEQSGLVCDECEVEEFHRSQEEAEALFLPGGK